MHAEDSILNFSPMRHKINTYPRKENNFGYGSSMVLLDKEQLVDTIIAGNTYLRGNIILDRRDYPLYTLTTYW